MKNYKYTESALNRLNLRAKNCGILQQCEIIELKALLSDYYRDYFDSRRAETWLRAKDFRSTEENAPWKIIPSSKEADGGRRYTTFDER